jgi:hypothetical protein
MKAKNHSYHLIQHSDDAYADSRNMATLWQLVARKICNYAPHIGSIEIFFPLE